MKIAYVTMQWPAVSETFAARDVKALIRAGDEVSIYALLPDFRNVNSISRGLGVETVPVLRMGLKQHFSGFLNVFRYFPLCLGLLFALFKHEKRFRVLLKSILLFPAVFLSFDHIVKNKFDVVHLFWGHFPAMVGWLIQQKKPEMMVTQFLGPYDLRYHYGLSAVVGKDVLALFTHSSANIETLIERGIPSEKIKVVHRGIETSGKETSGVSKENKKFIYVGRLIRSKGIFEMLSVFLRIVEVHPKAHLIVVGDGECRTDFERKIDEYGLRNNITVTGWLSPEEVVRQLSQARMMLFLSHVECLPNAVKEAMLHRVIPISTYTTGIDELISHGQDGFIVRDEDETIDVVLRVLDEPQMQEQIGAQARQKILDQFDVDVAMNTYRDVWLKR